MQKAHCRWTGFWKAHVLGKTWFGVTNRSLRLCRASQLPGGGRLQLEGSYREGPLLLGHLHLKGRRGQPSAVPAPAEGPAEQGSTQQPALAQNLPKGPRLVSALECAHLKVKTTANKSYKSPSLPWGLSSPSTSSAVAAETAVLKLCTRGTQTRPMASTHRAELYEGSLNVRTLISKQCLQASDRTSPVTRKGYPQRIPEGAGGVPPRVLCHPQAEPLNPPRTPGGRSWGPAVPAGTLMWCQTSL